MSDSMIGEGTEFHTNTFQNRHAKKMNQKPLFIEKPQEHWCIEISPATQIIIFIHNSTNTFHLYIEPHIPKHYYFFWIYRSHSTNTSQTKGNKRKVNQSRSSEPNRNREEQEHIGPDRKRRKGNKWNRIWKRLSIMFLPFLFL